MQNRIVSVCLNVEYACCRRPQAERRSAGRSAAEQSPRQAATAPHRLVWFISLPGSERPAHTERTRHSHCSKPISLQKSHLRITPKVGSNSLKLHHIDLIQIVEIGGTTGVSIKAENCNGRHRAASICNAS